MKIPYFCCIGAELKRYQKDFDFMNQVYLYKIPTDDTLEEVLTQDYFQAIADTVLQDDLLYIYEPTAQALHMCRFNKQGGHITAVQLSNNVPGLTPNRVLISDSTGHIAAGDVTLDYLKNKLNLDGTNTMTGPIKMRSSVSFKCAIAPSWDGVGFYKLNDNDSMTLMASMESTDGLTPAQNNTYNFGTSSRKWKDAYIARVITAVINNGFDIAVPVTNTPDTFALKSEVELAANSGRMITDQGVWFAKMYAATVPPAADDNTNYADFSQTDGDGNPIIVLYERQSGAWVQTQTITPPTNYDGYVPVTSKIWDIADQAGQQGGRVLWNHQSKEFTPYPNIVSFEDAALTGTPTTPTPTGASPNNQITNKDYVDGAVAASAATKANVDMDNLTSTGKNIANWSNNVSNCITEIPQDIKLELNAGTLTLKAGSKAYNANGLLVTTTNDLNVTWATTGTANVIVTADGQNLYVANYPGETVSTLPSPTTSYKVYFNTTDGKCYFDDGTMKEVSFPVAVITANGQINNIQNTFNGFGYIGSTVFALPGVKGLIPNGRNADGSLKSIEWTNNNVTTHLVSGAYPNFVLVFGETYNLIVLDQRTNVEYRENENIIWSKVENRQNKVIYAGFITSAAGGKITDFSIKTAFHAVDYNDSEYMANCAMPSDGSISITLGASGTQYTAPADGYFNFRGMGTAAGQYAYIGDPYYSGVAYQRSTNGNNDWIVATIPVKRGQSIIINYNTGANNALYFVYANGVITV